MRSNHDHTTRDAILTYLRVDDQPVALVAICKYMKVMHKANNGAVRECLRRLLKSGVIRHPSRGFYQRFGQSAGPIALEQDRPG